MSDINKTIGERLRQARNMLMLDQTQFGSRINILASNLSALEKGRSQIGPRILLSIEKEFGINIKWIQLGEGEPFLKYTNIQDRIRALIYTKSLTPQMICAKIGMQHLEELMGVIEENKKPGKDLLINFKREFPEFDTIISDQSENDGVPFIDYNQRGGKDGYLNIISGVDYKYYKIPVHGADRIIPSHQDFQGIVHKNDDLTIKKVDPYKFVQWEKLHVLDTDQGVIIRYLKPSEKGKDYIICYDGKYEFEVLIKDIFGIYIILSVNHHL